MVLSVNHTHVPNRYYVSKLQSNWFSWVNDKTRGISAPSSTCFFCLVTFLVGRQKFSTILLLLVNARWEPFFPAQDIFDVLF